MIHKATHRLVTTLSLSVRASTRTSLSRARAKERPSGTYRCRHQPSASYASSQKSSDVYVIKPSANANEITIRDRVRLIPLGDGVIHVLLSRATKLNSLDMPMFEAIADAAHRLRTDKSWSRDLRAVIVSGEGRAFCTGLDAKSVALSGPSKSLERLLERPSAYGGEGGMGNLAQDVSYLWR